MLLNKVYLLLGLVIIGFSSQAQTIITGAYVSGTWDSTGSPYIIQDPISVHEDSSLHILPGVTVAFSDSAYLIVDGYINAQGTISDSVLFTSYQSVWQGVRVFYNDSVYQNNSLFNYCSFTNANSSFDFVNGGALMIENRDDVSLFNCSFKNNFAENRGGAIYLDNSNTMIKSSSFEFNTTGLVPGFSKGGAIYTLDSEPSLEKCFFQNNQSVVAGALYTDNSSMDIDECSFENNMSRAGGGAFVAHHSGVLSIDDCLFNNNFANGSGGAIAILEGVWARFRDCTITDNTSETDLYLADGGGVLITPYDNEVTFINCNISYNMAGDYGGGVYATSASQFISCLFNSNQAALDSSGPGGGGAILMSLANIPVLNCTFSGNTGGDGSTILCEDANFSLINTIIWDDTVSPDSKIFLSSIEEPPQLLVSHCDIEGGQGVIRGTGAYEVMWTSGNINENPRFEIPGMDFSLSNESPCIDTGRIDTLQLLIPSTDIAGNPRIYRGVIDMGCYENQFPFGILELKAQSDLLIYPNPACNFVNIHSELEYAFNGSLILTDINGRELITERIIILPYSTYRQQLNGIPSGLYILSIVSEDNKISKKIIIQ